MLIAARTRLTERAVDVTTAHAHHAVLHATYESPLALTGVFMILAVLSIVGGWIGWPAALGGSLPTPFQRWLEPVLLPLGGHEFHFHEASIGLEIALMATSVTIAVIGIFIAFRFYKRDETFSIPNRLAT